MQNFETIQVRIKMRQTYNLTINLYETKSLNYFMAIKLYFNLK